MAKNKVVKKLTKIQQGKVNKLADTLIAPEIDRPIGYITISKVIEVEETFAIKEIKQTGAGSGLAFQAKDLKSGLENGDLNMIQSATVEPYVWVVNKDGARVALLEKDGGVGPSEKLTIEIL